MKLAVHILRLLAVAALLAALSESEAATHTVRMVAGNRFDPATLTIDPGDTVTWVNRTTTRHDTASDDGHWASPLLRFNESFPFTFNLPPGSYGYVCTPHVNIGMIGTIIVRAPANTPPSVAITAPPTGTTVEFGQAITVSVTATDDGSISLVELLVNGAVAQSSTTQPYQFTLNLGAGTHQLTARARDNLGATATSGAISVTVRGPNQPPTVTLISPEVGTLTAPAELTLAATASDDNAVQRVEFLINGEVVGPILAQPYSVQRTFTAGTYAISARAFDAAGLSATSASVTIQVNDPVPEFPRVRITSPEAEQYIAFEEMIMLMAEATDADGSIASVEFREEPASLGAGARVGTTANYMLMTPLSEGFHSIVAIATDNAGNSTTSNPVRFAVVLQPEFTSLIILSNGVARLSFFGTSDVPFVFERSEDGAAWNPFLTNSLVRRILFFDDPEAAGRANLMYRGRSPVVTPGTE